MIRLLALAAALVCVGVAAQDGPGSAQKTVRVVRTATPPVIDGVVGETEWANAARVDDLHQIQPEEYAPPTERTEVLVFYDDDALYIAARLYGPPLRFGGGIGLGRHGGHRA